MNLVLKTSGGVKTMGIDTSARRQYYQFCRKTPILKYGDIRQLTLYSYIRQL